VPAAAALRSEAHEVSDGSQQVDAALGDFGGHPRMRRVEAAHFALGVARENGNCGVLMPFGVFAARVIIEDAVAGANETQLVPGACATVGAQSGDVRSAVATF